jgi:hypothetical protein
MRLGAAVRIPALAASLSEIQISPRPSRKFSDKPMPGAVHFFYAVAMVRIDVPS